jgi:hypothetical protein
MSGVFSLLPDELVLYIALILSPDFLINLCLTNSKFVRIILNDDAYACPGNRNIPVISES